MLGLKFAAQQSLKAHVKARRGIRHAQHVDMLETRMRVTIKGMTSALTLTVRTLEMSFSCKTTTDKTRDRMVVIHITRDKLWTNTLSNCGINERGK